MAEIYVVPKPVLTKDIFTKTSSNPSNPRSKTFMYPDGYISLLKGKTPELRLIRRYLVNRGFPKSYWKKYNLGNVPGSMRVCIPIEGEFWQARAILPWIQPKYMSPENPAADVLFNYQALNNFDEIVVTEGAFSAMAVGDNAVALIGKNPTSEKIRRLVNSNASKFIVVVEQNAWSMLSLADSLVARNRCVELWMYENGKDPADRVEPTIHTYNFKKKVELAFSR